MNEALCIARANDALQSNVTAINGGIIADPLQFRRANRRLVQWSKPPARTYMDRLIQFPTDMKCNRNMRAILESTLAEYMDGQQREGWGGEGGLAVIGEPQAPL